MVGERDEVGAPGSLRGKITMTKFMTRFVRDESGATAIEYGLIAALMAVAVIAAVGVLDDQMISSFTSIGQKMQVP